MILTKEQLQSITAGSLRITEEHGYDCFHRYAEEQEFCYEDHNSDFHRKTLATAGVRLDFVTDSLSLSFDYELHSASSRFFYYFDVFVDGKPHAHIGEPKRTARRATFEVDLPVGEKRVTVWFPCLFQVLVRNVTLTDGATFAPVSYKGTLLAIGDSITHGYDAVYSSCTYPALLAQRFELNVINQGIGGDVYHDYNLGEGIGLRPDYITVALGTNDWSNRTKDRFVECLNQFYTKLNALYPEAKIAVITPLWRGDIDRVTKVGTFEEAVSAIREAASVCKNVKFICGQEMLEHKKALFSPDVLHPNDLGFENLVSHLAPALREAFGIE